MPFENQTKMSSFQMSWFNRPNPEDQKKFNPIWTFFVSKTDYQYEREKVTKERDVKILLKNYVYTEHKAGASSIGVPVNLVPIFAQNWPYLCWDQFNNVTMVTAYFLPCKC